MYIIVHTTDPEVIAQSTSPHSTEGEQGPDSHSAQGSVEPRVEITYQTTQQHAISDRSFSDPNCKLYTITNSNIYHENAILTECYMPIYIYCMHQLSFGNIRHTCKATGRQ